MYNTINAWTVLLLQFSLPYSACCTINEKLGHEETRGQVLPSSVINRKLPAGIRLIEDNAKSLWLKSNLEKDFAASVYFVPSPPR